MAVLRLAVESDPRKTCRNIADHSEEFPNFLGGIADDEALPKGGLRFPAVLGRNRRKLLPGRRCVSGENRIRGSSRISGEYHNCVARTRRTKSLAPAVRDGRDAA